MSQRIRREFVDKVHIPPCQPADPKCSQTLTRLGETLTEKGLQVFKYPSYGKYTDIFEQAFDSCQVTVFHVCPRLWERVQKFQQKISVNSENKFIFVITFLEEDDIRNVYTQANWEHGHAFFSEYILQTMYDDQSIMYVSEEIVSVLKDTPIELTLPLTSPDFYNQPSNHLGVSSDESSDEDIEVEHLENKKHVDEKCVDIFGNQTTTEVSSLTYPDVPMKRILREVLLTETSDEFFTSNCKYIMYKLFPELFKSGNIVMIALITRGATKARHTHLAKRACTLLELFFFLNEDEKEKKLDVQLQKLINLEGILFMTLHKLSKELSSDVERDVDMVFIKHRLIYVYIIVLCEMILLGKEKSGSTRICFGHLHTISGRDLLSKEETERDKYLLDINNFVMDAVAETNSLLKKANQMIKEEMNIMQMTDNLAVLAVSIFMAFKKIFQSLDPSMLNLLKDSVSSYAAMLKKRKVSVHPVLVSMILYSLLHFLHYGLREKANDQTSDQRKSAIEIVKEMVSIIDEQEMLQALKQELLWDDDKEVRDEIFKIMSKKKMLNKKEVDQLRLTQVETILSPLLVFKSHEPYEEKIYNEKAGKWRVLSGNFDKARCIVHVMDHPRVEIDAKAPDDYHEQELKVLKALSHSCILKLLAQEETRAPKFYITEDYLHFNLQKLLTNRRSNKNFFRSQQLFEFLQNALSALKYLHAKNFIHRNLTANSLFLTQYNSVVKLAGFQLCQKLAWSREGFKDISRPPIPTRWSAPESLSKGEFSKSSDMWMVGHLVYEVATHGLLPYSHLNIEDKELVKLILQDEQVSLKNEMCLTGKTRKLIKRCIQGITERPSLEEIMADLDDPLCWDTSKMTEDFACCEGTFSTQYSVGIPDIEEPNTTVTSDTTRSEFWQENVFVQKRENKYIFTQCVNRRLSYEIFSTVEEPVEALQPFLPVIHSFQSNKELPQIQCEVPGFSRVNSLYEVTRKRKLGDELLPYLKCVHSVALVMNALHQEERLLGHVSTPTVCVQKLSDGTVQNNIVNFAHLNATDKSLAFREVPAEESVWARAAPEVMEHGEFSLASDIYCLGLLLWEVLNLFDNPIDKDNYFVDGAKDCSPFANKSKDENLTAKKITGVREELLYCPSCCPEGLYTLVKMCVNYSDSDRPKLAHVLDRLSQLLQSASSLTFEDKDNEIRVEEISHDLQEDAASSHMYIDICSQPGDGKGSCCNLNHHDPPEIYSSSNVSNVDETKFTIINGADSGCNTLSLSELEYTHLSSAQEETLPQL